MNEFEYEKNQPQALHGAYESLISTLANVVERVRYTNPAYKPSIKFTGNTCTFVVNAYQYADSGTKKALVEQFSQAFKKIFDIAKDDLVESGCGFTFETKFIDDDFEILAGNRSTAKSYVQYVQNWEINIISTLDEFVYTPPTY